jgi:hypothetical protein
MVTSWSSGGSQSKLEEALGFHREIGADGHVARLERELAGD